jgi:DNA-directed RNA polymerase subunit M/transcription elongation factor TFIIS
MEIIRNDNRARYGIACTECNDLLIAPKRSWHAGEQEVYHFWSCDNCGHEIEMVVNLRIDAASGKAHNASEWVCA